LYSCVTDLPAELVSRPLDGDQTETWARFPEVSDPDLLAVLPDGRVVLTVLYSDRPRLMVVEPGKKPVALVATTEENSTPITVAGPREIAFLIGPVPRATVAFADVETGRITRRIAPGKGEIVSLAASPDGGTLYFATGGTIWSIPSAGGQARKIRAGDRIRGSLEFLWTGRRRRKSPPMHRTRQGIRTSRPVAGMRTAASWFPFTRRGSQRRP
jgi:hypothetical protein